MKISQVVVPNTGGWQIWQSVVKTIKIDQGKHYFKLVAVTGGFNINYFNVQKVLTDINSLKIDDIIIFPNPASNHIVIKSSGFQYNKVEVIEYLGKIVLSKSVQYEPELNLPISLTNGAYIVKISNGLKYQEKRIIINKN